MLINVKCQYFMLDVFKREHSYLKKLKKYSTSVALDLSYIVFYMLIKIQTLADILTFVSMMDFKLSCHE